MAHSSSDWRGAAIIAQLPPMPWSESESIGPSPRFSLSSLRSYIARLENAWLAAASTYLQKEGHDSIEQAANSNTEDPVVLALLEEQRAFGDGCVVYTPLLPDHLESEIEQAIASLEIVLDAAVEDDELGTLAECLLRVPKAFRDCLSRFGIVFVSSIFDVRLTFADVDRVYNPAPATSNSENEGHVTCLMPQTMVA